MAAATTARPLGPGGQPGHVVRSAPPATRSSPASAAAAPGRDRRRRRRRRHRGGRRAGRRRRAREPALGGGPAHGPPGRTGRARRRGRGRDRPPGRPRPPRPGRRPRPREPAVGAGHGGGGQAARRAAGRPGPLRVPPPDRARPAVPEAGRRRAARLHRRVGEALEELTGGTSRLGELADHFALAGPGSADRAVDYAHRAGEQAFAERRYEEAAHRHRQGLAVLERHDGAAADPERRGELLLGQGDAWSAAGQTHQATQAYLRRRRPPGRPGPPTAWPGPPWGWAAPPASVGRARPPAPRPGCWTRPWRPPARATAAPARCCWPAWPAGGPPGRASGTAGPAGQLRRGGGDGGPPRRPRHPGRGPGRPGDRLERRPAAGRARRRPGRRRRAGAAGRRARRRAPGLPGGPVPGGGAAGRRRPGGVDRLAEREDLAGARRAHRRWLALRLRAAGAMLRGEFLDSERLAEAAWRWAGARSARRPAWPTAPSWCSCAGSRAGPGRSRRCWRTSGPSRPGGARLAEAAGTGLRRPGREDDARRLLEAAAGAARRPAERGRAGRRWPAPSSATRAPASGGCSPWSGHHLAAGHVYLGAADHHLGILAATGGRWRTASPTSRPPRPPTSASGRALATLTAQALAGTLRGRDGPGDRARAVAMDAAAATAAGRLGMEPPGWGRPSLGPRTTT